MQLENDTLLLENVRLSFPSLKTPKASAPGGALKYRASFLFEPGGPAANELQALIQKVATDKWGAQAQQVLQVIANDRKLRCYGMGEQKISAKTGAPYEGYAGMMYVDALRDDPPGLRSEQNVDIDPMTIGTRFQGGDWVDAGIRLWAQDNANGKAIRCELIAVKFLREGEHFGAERASADDIFGASTGAQSAAAAEKPADVPPAGNLFG